MVKRFSLFFLLFLLHQATGAQLLFTTLKQSDGLSSREAHCVFRDAEGFLWAGAYNGLNRFDGAGFKLWNKSVLGYPAGLGEVVTSIVEHRPGNIWFGTNAGVAVLDKATGSIVEASFRGVKSARPAIAKLEHDAQGGLWVSTNSGLFIERNGSLVPASTLYPFAKALDTLIYLHSAFAFDTVRNCFWMGTTSGSFCLDLKNKQLLSADNNSDGNPFFTKDILISIALDKDDNLWYSNTSSLAQYSLRTKVHQVFHRINNNPAWELKDGCNALFCDAEGRLWISTWLYSAFIHYPDGHFEQIPYDKNRPQSIGYGFFFEASQDVYGNVWLATLNGLSKLAANRFVQDIIEAPSFKSYLPVGFANINTVALDEDGNVWMGKIDGLIKYNITDKSFERYVISTTNLLRNEILSLKFVNGEAWCATTHGLHIFNPASKSFRTLHYKTGIVDHYVRWILPSKKGDVWFSVYDEGVYHYAPANGQCELLNDASLLNSNAAFEASDGQLWLGTLKGVRLFNPGIDKISSPAASPFSGYRSSSFTEDGAKNVWISIVGLGLVKCNAQGQAVDSINRQNGLPVDGAFKISADLSGRLWATSRESLLCILPQSKEVNKVNIPVNFSFNDHWNALLQKGPLLYAAMLDNVVVLNTANYQRLPQNKSPLISGFRVFGKEVPLPAQGVQLNYNQNFFSIGFASPFHQEALAMQYAYKLEGFDKDWVYCGRTLSATYTNIPDGNYHFLVRTTNEGGKWMEEATVVPITIRPPFWKRAWFVSLLAIAAAFLLYWLYLLRNRQRQEKRIDETISYFANSYYGDNSVSEICWDIARNCISQLKLEDCVVYLLDEKRNVLVQKAAYGSKNPKEHEIINPIEIQMGEGIVGAAAAAGKPVLVKDTTMDSRYVVDDQRRLSELAVPIVHEGKSIGVIDSEHSRRGFFTDDHAKALSTIAAISANKIAEAEAEEAARESEIQLLEIKKLYAESQLMALRAQMNPHFVFNCLNSIQECIVTEKYGEASLYLNKFAKLFRSVLNNSGKVMVTLAEEIEVLDLYLTLEYMRFEHSFSYSIEVEEDLESEEMLIPSMLLQPYVENALWHGLMHKPADRNLTILFRRKGADVFQCVIDDNGIGRKKALELKQQQSKTKRHVSKGMTISQDRIVLLQKQGQHAVLTIVDKYQPDGEPTGTKVIVELSAFLE